VFLSKGTSLFSLTDIKESDVMDANSQNILKALLLLVSKMNELNSTITRIEELLKEVVSPKQEESN
jgi:hypothetical protein